MNIFYNPAWLLTIIIGGSLIFSIALGEILHLHFKYGHKRFRQQYSELVKAYENYSEKAYQSSLFKDENCTKVMVKIQNLREQLPYATDSERPPLCKEIDELTVKLREKEQEQEPFAQEAREAYDLYIAEYDKTVHGDKKIAKHLANYGYNR